MKDLRDLQDFDNTRCKAYPQIAQAGVAVGGVGRGIPSKPRPLNPNLSTPTSHTRTRKLSIKATWKRELKLPWREAGPPNHHNDKVDSDQ